MEELFKAFLETPTLLKATHGKWRGLAVIAIGPRGGKIIGYRAGGIPIYAGSKVAEKLADIKELKEKKKISPTQELKTFLEWLLGLDIEGKVSADTVRVSEAAAKVLSEAFGVKSKPGKDGTRVFARVDLEKHVGEPLTPVESKRAAWAARIASGQDNDGTFPDDLNKLVFIQSVGSHGVLELQDPDTKKFYYFKKDDQVIVRAEEAASRLGKLVLPDLVPSGELKEYKGKKGLLLEGKPGKVFSSPSQHSDPPFEYLKKHAYQIMQHEVLDWFISNHDSHGGNFLSHGDDCYAIDKGQAWKWIGKDELDPNYRGTGNPNHSYQIYRRFWERVQDGSIPKEGLIDAAAKTCDSIDKITDDQFWDIVAPYVNQAAESFGVDPKTQYSKMLNRKNNVRSDFEKFLSKQFGQSVTLAKVGAEQTKEEKAETFVIPVVKPVDEPVTIAAKEKQPIAAPKPVPGWPITKGAKGSYVTVLNPGIAPTSALAAKGLPGVGYLSNITYKKQMYILEVVAGEKKPQFKITYPDGNSKVFNSINHASGSLYLYNNGLPLDMTTTEMKAKKIGLGAKVFRFDEFKEELASVYSGGEISPNQMTPKELETAKLVEEGAKEVNVFDLLDKEPDGIVSDFGMLPPHIQEFLKANSQAVGADWKPALIPGIPVKISPSSKEGGTIPYIVCAYIAPSGDPGYKTFNKAGNEFTWQEPYIDFAKWPEVEGKIAALLDVKQKKEAALAAIPPPKPKAKRVPSEANWETMPEYAPYTTTYLDSLPNGTQLKVGLNIYTKEIFTAAGTGYQVTNWKTVTGSDSYHFNSLDIVDNIQEHISEGIFIKKPVDKVPSEANWETMPDEIELPYSLEYFISKLPINTKIAVGTSIYIKSGITGNWNKTSKSGAGWDLSSLAVVDDIKEFIGNNPKANVTYSKSIAETPTPPVVGSPPKAVLPESATVPDYAPEYYDTPIAPGTIIQVSKKFKQYPSPLLIKLTLLDNGAYQVTLPNYVSSEFSSISMASTYAYISMLGYAGIADYKIQNKTEVLPSGGGWKFWGLNVETPPEVEQAPVENKAFNISDYTVGDKLPGTMSLVEIDSLPIGIKLGWGKKSWTKLSASNWEFSDGMGKFPSAAANIPFEKGVTILELPKAVAAPVEETEELKYVPPLSGKDYTTEFKDLPKSIAEAVIGNAVFEYVMPFTLESELSIALLPSGTVISGMNKKGDTITYEKTSESKWLFQDLSEGKTAFPIDESNISLSDFNTLIDPTISFSKGMLLNATNEVLEKLPIGSTFGAIDSTIGYYIKYTKIDKTNFQNTVGGLFNIGDFIGYDLIIDTIPTTPASIAPATTPSADNWETMPDVESGTEWAKEAPIGTKIKFVDKYTDKEIFFTKINVDQWDNVNNISFPDISIGGSIESINVLSTYFIKPGVATAPTTETEALPNWVTMPDAPIPDILLELKLGDKISSSYGSLGVNDLPIGTVLQSSDDYTYTKVGDGKWGWVYKDNPYDTGFTSSGYIASAPSEIYLQDLPKAVLDKLKKVKNANKGLASKKPAVSSLPSNLITTKDQLPEALHDIIDTVQSTLYGEDNWLTIKPGSDHALGEKPPTWEPWVPPVGILLKGEFNGKDYYLIQTAAGYDKFGNPGSVSFTVIEPDGTKHTGFKTTGKEALKSALVQFPEFASLHLPALKKIFGLNKLSFAPGETHHTVTTGIGISALPQATAPDSSDLSDDDKPTPVKVTTTVEQFIKDHALTKTGVLKMKPAKDKKYMLVALDKTNDSGNKLKQIIKDALGLEATPVTNSWGSYVYVEKTDLEKAVVMETTALKATTAPIGNDGDNWKPLDKIALSDLGGYPSGTIIKLIHSEGVETVFTKQVNGIWKSKHADDTITFEENYFVKEIINSYTSDTIKSVYIPEIEHKEAEPPVKETPSAPNWETMPESIPGDWTIKAPIGTKVNLATKDGKYESTYIKSAKGTWDNSETGFENTEKGIQEHIQDAIGKLKITYLLPADSWNSIPDNLKNNKLEFKTFYDSLPTGTVFQSTDLKEGTYANYTKLEDGSVAASYSTDNPGEPPDNYSYTSVFFSLEEPTLLVKYKLPDTTSAPNWETMPETIPDKWAESIPVGGAVMLTPIPDKTIAGAITQIYIKTKNNTWVNAPASSQLTDEKVNTGLSAISTHAISYTLNYKEAPKVEPAPKAKAKGKGKTKEIKYKEQTYQKKMSLKMLEKAPIGTVIKGKNWQGVETVFTKINETQWQKTVEGVVQVNAYTDTGAHGTYNVKASMNPNYFDGKIIKLTPNQKIAPVSFSTVAVTPAVATPAPKPVPAPAPVLTEEQKAAIAAKKAKAEELKAKAKAIAEWAKGHKPLDQNSSVNKALAYLQEVYQGKLPGVKAWARVDNKGNVVMGSDNADFKATLADILGKAYPEVTTPLGVFNSIPSADLLKAFPQSEMIKLEDGSVVPYGTKTVSKIVQKEIPQSFTGEGLAYKWKEHKADPENSVALKILLDVNNKEATKAKADEIISKYGLHPQGEFIYTDKYLIISLPKAEQNVTVAETVIEKDIPPQPKPFFSMPLPSLGENKENGIATSNRADLSLMESIKPGPFGYTIRMGKSGIFKDYQVQIRKLKTHDGKEVYEVLGNLVKFDPNQSNLEDHKSYELHYGHKYIDTDWGSVEVVDYDEYTGFHTQEKSNIQSHSSSWQLSQSKLKAQGKPITGTTVEVFGSGYGTKYLTNAFRVQVPIGLDLETELYEAFAHMGVDPDKALAEPDEHDELMFKKYQIARSLMGGEGWDESIHDFEKWTNEKELDAIIKQRTGSLDIVDTAMIVQKFGRHSVITPGEEEKAKAAGVKFAYAGTDIGLVYLQLLHQWGSVSLKQRYSYGVEGNPQSAPDDMAKGGAQATYLRAANVNSGGGWGNVKGQPSSNGFIIYHPRVFNRADSWLFPSDPVGSCSGNTPKDKVYGMVNSSNEFMVQDGVSFADAAGVMVPTESIRKQFIKKLNEAGASKINGIPVDKFIISYESTGSKSAVANALYGLQGSNLP